ncbi:hypothetical protein [Microbispora rosea]|uniref:hypothetical protein n=1 Tax=Microbispora rosea TaxID=58117 RepID=UPI0012DC5CF8|nr:hypothetical protein [Microbispora rosea]
MDLGAQRRVTCFGRTTFALLLAPTALAATACGGPEWQDMPSAMLSKDERTLTVELTFKRPENDKKQCQQVTERKVEESASQVVIGVQVQDDCPRPSKPTIAIGYVRRVTLHLKQPLGGRIVLENVHHRRVRIYRSPDGS